MQVVKKTKAKYRLNSIGVGRKRDPGAEFGKARMERMLETCNGSGEFSNLPNETPPIRGGKICWLNYVTESTNPKIHDILYLSYREFVRLGKPRRLSVDRTTTYKPK